MSYKHTWIALTLNYLSFLFVVFIYGFRPVRIPNHEMYGGSNKKCTAVPSSESRTVYRLLHLLVLSCGQIGEMRSLYQRQLLMEATLLLLLCHSRGYRYRISIIGNKFLHFFRVRTRTSHGHSCRGLAVTGTTTNGTFQHLFAYS